MKIVDIKQLQHPALLDYISSRGIDISVAKANCFEVHYERDDKQYFAIGFANDSDGWEFRNPHFKGGFSPKDITTRNSGYAKVIVFEGFMDCLAYLTLKGGVAPAADILVLNSVANIKKALPFLQKHSQIKLMLDNDDAGRRAVEDIKRPMPGVDIVDCSTSYAQCKDLNDYLLSKLRQ